MSIFLRDLTANRKAVTLPMGIQFVIIPGNLGTTSGGLCRNTTNINRNLYIAEYVVGWSHRSHLRQKFSRHSVSNNACSAAPFFLPLKHTFLFSVTGAVASSGSGIDDEVCLWMWAWAMYILDQAFSPTRGDFETAIPPPPGDNK